MAAPVARLSGQLPAWLGERGVEAGDRIAYSFRSRPLNVGTPDEIGRFLPLSGLVVDLALQAAGFEAVPWAGPLEEKADLAAHPKDDNVSGPGQAGFAGPGREQVDKGEALWLLAPDHSARRSGEAAGRPPPSSRRRPGGPGEAEGWFNGRQLDPDAWQLDTLDRSGSAGTPAPAPPPLTDLLGAARRLTQQSGVRTSAPARPSSLHGSQAEVTVGGRGWGDAGERLLLAWSILTAGALVLEPDPTARVTAAAWARPTLFLGDEEELARLRSEAETWHSQWRDGLLRRWWRRLRGTDPAPGPPFGRLHTVVRDSREPEVPPVLGDDFWRRRGVVEVDLASLVQ